SRGRFMKRQQSGSELLSRILVRETNLGAQVRHRNSYQTNHQWSIVGRLTMAILILGALCLLGSSCKREGAAPQGVVMQLAPSTAEYRLNEEIIIAVRFTNREDKPCRFMPLPDVTIHILAMSRDGTPLVPDWTTRTYLYGFEEFILDNLEQIE